MYIDIYRPGGRVQIGPRSDIPFGVGAKKAADGSSKAGERLSSTQAKSFLRLHFAHSADISRLRSVLAHDVQGLFRMSDEEVLAEVAYRLTSGLWVIHETAAVSPAGQAQEGAQRSNGGSSSSSGSAPAPAPAPVPRAQPEQVRERPAPAPAPVVAPEAQDWSAAASDQVAQAEVLEQAALLAIPFCEVCEAAKGRRAEAAS